MPILQESRVVVESRELSIIMPPSNQWGKVWVGLGFGNSWVER